MDEEVPCTEDVRCCRDFKQFFTLIIKGASEPLKNFWLETSTWLPLHFTQF